MRTKGGAFRLRHLQSQVHPERPFSVEIPWKSVSWIAYLLDLSVPALDAGA